MIDGAKYAHLKICRKVTGRGKMQNAEHQQRGKYGIKRKYFAFYSSSVFRNLRRSLNAKLTLFIGNKIGAKV